MEKLSEGKRILYVFIKPFRAMQDIAGNRGFAIPITCMLVFPLLNIALNMEYYRDQLFNALVASYQMMGMPLDSANVGSLVQTQLYVTLGSTPVMTIITWLLFSLLLFLLTLPFEGKEEFGLKTLFSITGYAFLIKSLFYVANTINIYFFPDNILTFSLYDIVRIFQPINSMQVTGVLQLISVFRVWEYAVIGVGICAAKKISKIKAALIMLIIVALYIALVFVQTALVPAATAG